MRFDIISMKKNIKYGFVNPKILKISNLLQNRHLTNRGFEKLL